MTRGTAPMTRYHRLEAPRPGRQQFTEVADVGGGLVVSVARWPVRPDSGDQPRPPEVCWLYGTTYRYLSPQAARRFAAALMQAADEIEREEASH